MRTIFGILPIAEALVAKGVGIGTASSLYDGGHSPITTISNYVKKGG